MAKIQSKAKRVLAIAIALMMVFGACFTGMVTASAESLATGLDYVATTDTDAGTANVANRTITAIEGGGITYTSPSKSLLSPYVHNVATGGFPGNGVSLQFDNYSTTATVAGRGYRAIAIVLGKHTAAGTAYRL